MQSNVSAEARYGERGRALPPRIPEGDVSLHLPPSGSCLLIANSGRAVLRWRTPRAHTKTPRTETVAQRSTRPNRHAGPQDPPLEASPPRHAGATSPSICGAACSYVGRYPTSRPSGEPMASPIRCIHAGGNGRRTVSKCAPAITASRSGFGIPFRFVFPSAASANIVSSSYSNPSAGRISQMKRAGVFAGVLEPMLAFRRARGYVARAAPRSLCLRELRSRARPSAPRSALPGSGERVSPRRSRPAGRRTSISTSSPPVSAEVFTNVRAPR